MSVELHLTCVGATAPHGFIKVFPDPVDWDGVNKWLKWSEARCEEHPEPTYYWDE